MKIKAITEIQNYRNLSQCTIHFDQNINFIIGENDIGKTNVLDLFDAFFNHKKFKPTDFFDTSKPISISIELYDGTILTGVQKTIDGYIQYNRKNLDVFNFLLLKIPNATKEDECIQRIYKLINNFVHSKEKSHFIEENGKKILPLYIMIDEPENHLPPHRQRSLIKKLSNILKDENIPYFGMRQFFIVTHSPNILLHNYNQFIRMMRVNNGIKVISGNQLPIYNTTLFKHMLHNFIYLKEAMFSKCILFVEGDTENGAFQAFASRMNIDLDANGIGVVKLDGAESVLKCMSLYYKFGINNIAILDRDKFEKYHTKKYIFFTDAIDFEEDIYDHFSLQDYLYCLKDIGGLSHFINILRDEGYSIDPNAFLENPTIDIDSLSSKRIMAKYKEDQLHFLREKKNALKGFMLAYHVTTIPNAYRKVITEALKKTKS